MSLEDKSKLAGAVEKDTTRLSQLMADTTPTLIVGLGASAGGLEALERLFRAQPPGTGCAFVVVLHLSPDMKSRMPELLRRCTSMEVAPAEGDIRLERDTVYVLTPGQEVRIDPKRLHLLSVERDADESGPRTPINLFFESLSKLGERAVAVVLSGTGTDGSLGIQSVHATGGLVLAQSAQSARFDGMPRSAVETGCVDSVLAPEEIPEAIHEFAADPAAGRKFERLESVRERLQHTIEVVEASGQELQAGNEELIASNKELQSTNEELHAVNEELYSVNAEHEQKIRELNAVSADLNNLIRSTGLATLFLDTEYRIRLFTPETQQVFRLLPGDVGRDLRDFTTREHDPDLFEDLKTAMSMSQSVDRELAWSDGRHFMRRISAYRDLENRTAGLVLTYLDVSEQTRLRTELHEQQVRFRATVEAAPASMVMIDGKGVIVLVNSETEHLFGYERDELIGQPIERLLPERFRDAHPRLRSEFFDAPHARRMGAGRELYGLSKDGTEFPIDIGLNPVHTDEGTFVLAAVVDLTERKRAEADLQKANEALTHSNLAQQQFIYIVSHDLREPINTINNFAGLLLEDWGSRIDETGQRYLSHVRAGAERIRVLLDDLLGYVRLDRNVVDKNPVDLNLVLEDVLKDIAAALEERDALVTCPELPVVAGQVSMLRVLFQNLLDNATKFHRSGLQPRVELTWRRTGSEVEIAVTDNGIGIEPEQLGRAFELFKRLHPKRSDHGTGIGLAMCKKIVELHQGRIWIESTPGVGTRIVVALPESITTLEDVRNHDNDQ